MLQKLKERKNQKGFTIIEVLIVLAIAGLILLVVFLAVPALQRNSRNTQRNNDVAAVIGAMQEFINNSGGQVPDSCDGTDCDFISNAKLGFYQPANFNYTEATTAGAVSGLGANDIESIEARSYSTCNATGTGSTGTGSTTRSIAIIYNVETGGGTPQQQCKTVQ